MGSSRTTASPTTDAQWAARELVRTIVQIRKSLLSGLPPMQRGHVELCSVCADKAVAFVRSVLMHAPAADERILTLVRQALQQSAVPKSGAAKSKLR